MRYNEIMLYLEAYKTIQELELNSGEVREYLKNIQFLKTMPKDFQSLKDLQENIDEKQYVEIMKIVGKSIDQTKGMDFRQIDLSSPKRIILSQAIVNEFEKVLRNGTSAIELHIANLSDYLQKEVLLELKPSVARLINSEGKVLCVISGRKGFVQRVRQLIENENLQHKLKKDTTDNYQKEIQKIHKRIPGWFINLNQINSRILMAFMQTSNCNQNAIYPTSIEQACGLEHKVFEQNFNNMKRLPSTIGKVFEDNGYGMIRLWEPVADFIITEYKKIYQ